MGGGKPWPRVLLGCTTRGQVLHLSESILERFECYLMHYICSVSAFRLRQPLSRPSSYTRLWSTSHSSLGTFLSPSSM